MYVVQTSYQGEPCYLCTGEHGEYCWIANVNQARTFDNARDALRVATDATEDLSRKGFSEFVVEVVKINSGIVSGTDPS